MSLIGLALIWGCAVIAMAQPGRLCAAPASAAAQGQRAAAAARIGMRDSLPVPRELRRASDGLFYVDAIVNGASVRFLVDTGASTVVLAAHDARRAGISPAATGKQARADTANGGTMMSWVTLDHVRVAGTTARRMRAAVAWRGLAVSLLGQSWLSRLNSVTIEGDRMTLR